MSFQFRFFNVSDSFSPEEPAPPSWTAEIDDDGEFERLLNCLAIASSQGAEALDDFPRVEITKGSTRATVTAIRGELFYSESQSGNRQNLKVIPVEIRGLLQGRELDEVFSRGVEEAEAARQPEARYRRPASGSGFRQMLLLILFGVIAVCAWSVWRTLSFQPRLYPPPEFTILAEDRGRALIEQSSGVYVNEYREGGLVLELGQDGKFRHFELWYAPAERGFQLHPFRETEVLAGTDGSQSGFLILGRLFMAADGQDAVRLEGLRYERHAGPLADLGRIVGD